MSSRNQKRRCGTPGCLQPDFHLGLCGTKTRPEPGWRIRVWWKGDRRWFCGTLDEYDESEDTWLVKYDDGEVQQEPLNDPDLKWEPLGEEPSKTSAASSAAAQPTPPAEAKAPAKRKAPVKRKAQVSPPPEEETEKEEEEEDDGDGGDDDEEEEPPPTATTTLALTAAPAAASAGPSAYELQRMSNIARNQEQLVALGLDNASAHCKKQKRSSQPRKPKGPLPEVSRRSSRLEDAPRRSYAEDGGLGARSNLPPGTQLDAPRPKKPKISRLVHVDAPAELPPPLPSEEEATARVAFVRARFKELYLESQGSVTRPDLEAGKRCRQEGATCFDGPHAGALPGLPVGTEFFGKAEMAVCGMHNKWLSGIDYGKLQGQTIAVAVASSGGYEDDEDDGDSLWYTGSGGNDLLSSRRQVAGQDLTNGNLGLFNCIESKTPVRMIRFVGEVARERAYSGRLFIYDGLYAVTEYKHEVGTRQHGVFKFKLERLPDQPPLRNNASARLHQRLVDLATRDGTAGKRHLLLE